MGKRGQIISDALYILFTSLADPFSILKGLDFKYNFEKLTPTEQKDQVWVTEPISSKNFY